MRFKQLHTNITADLTLTPGSCTSVSSAQTVMWFCTSGTGTLLKAIQPYRDDVVIGAELVFTWYWIADLCTEEGLPFVLGHALYMKQSMEEKPR